ncbi:hydrolase 1, exosortase A system-associated [Sphingomonas sp.]|uniref:hydrolase 1, exosortase A system-associated n=1 Tax=Sphingomonas sp. TaxID=28214 RepID=UPI0025D3EB2D|nr:hydrolase 1, exosortase A system-associated [Sphingomonas sp.]
MRHSLTFVCESDELAATLDTSTGATGLLIVSGGNEIRIGAHRGMAELAAAVAERDYPVFRYDRRGIGDSEGRNAGYALSGPDIAAAVRAFYETVPALTRIVAFGNCDAATALVIHRADAAIDALVLANPWVIPPTDDLPPVAAIKSRYVRRLRDPAAWAALLTGRIDLGALGRGLGRLAMPKRDAPLAEAFFAALVAHAIPTTILLASQDATAVAFADAWQQDIFADARDLPTVQVNTFDSVSHSFASTADFTNLLQTILSALAG